MRENIVYLWLTFRRASTSDTLAASGPAVFTTMAVITLFTGTAGFSRSIVAQTVGKFGEKQARWEGLLGILVSCLLAVILLLVGPALANVPFFSDEPIQIVSLESQFIQIGSWFGALMIINAGFASYFNGMANTRITFLVGVLGQAVGAFAIICLVFGYLGMPALGMRGSAYGTLFSASVMSISYLFLLPRGFFAGAYTRIRAEGSSFVRNIAWRFQKGIPAGAAATSDELGNTAFVWLAGVIGPIALAANNIDLVVNYISIIPIIGLGIGCSVLCAQELGKADFSRIPKILAATILLEGIYVALTGCVQVYWPQVFLLIFDLRKESSEILVQAMLTEQVVWTYSAAFTFSMTGAAVLECFGLTSFILVIRLIVMWGLSIPLIYHLVHSKDRAGHPLVSIWLVGSAFELMIGAIYILRILKAVRREENAIQEMSTVA